MHLVEVLDALPLIDRHDVLGQSHPPHQLCLPGAAVVFYSNCTINVPSDEQVEVLMASADGDWGEMGFNVYMGGGTSLTLSNARLIPQPMATRSFR